MSAPTNCRRFPQASAPGGHGEKLSRKQEAAVAALLSEPTIGAAAVRVMVSERTLRTWMSLPAFRDAFAAARRRLLDDALGALQKAAGSAVATLDAIARDGAAPSPARVSASRALLEFTFKGSELLETNARLSVLEELLTKRGINGKH